MHGYYAEWLIYEQLEKTIRVIDKIDGGNGMAFINMNAIFLLSHQV